MSIFKNKEENIDDVVKRFSKYAGNTIYLLMNNFKKKKMKGIFFP